MSENLAPGACQHHVTRLEEGSGDASLQLAVQHAHVLLLVLVQPLVIHRKPIQPRTHMHIPTRTAYSGRPARLTLTLAESRSRAVLAVLGGKNSKTVGAFNSYKSCWVWKLASKTW